MSQLRPRELIDTGVPVHAPVKWDEQCGRCGRSCERQGVELRPGMTLTTYSDDANDDGRLNELLTEAVVYYNEAEKWVAAIDWQAIRHASDERTPATLPSA
jgi:hypothetical protein